MIGCRCAVCQSQDPRDHRLRPSIHVQYGDRGVLIDTPGLRELQLWEGSDAESVDQTFADVAALAAGCRFRDCQHDREPGCAVKHAVEQGAVSADRYANFLKLQSERAALHQRLDERALLEQKRQAKIANRSMKAMDKTKRQKF